MKLRSRFVLPPLDKSSRLPLLLALLLAAALAIQLLAADDVELPLAGPMGRGGGDLRIPAVPPSVGASAILDRSMFAPNAPSSASGAPASPLGDVVIVGSVRVGRAVMAVVQGPGNRIATVRVGGRVGDWKLRAVRESDAQLVRGEEQITAPFGARGILPSTTAATRNP